MSARPPERARWSFVTNGLAAALVALAVALPASSQTARNTPGGGFTWGDLALLPEICKDVQGVLYGLKGEHNDSPRTPQWLSLMGEDFWHMHHYCRGIRDVNQASVAGTGRERRRYLLGRSIGEFQYIASNVQPANPLLPDVYLRMGDSQLALGNLVEANNCFEESRRLKRDYWPAYTRWVDVLIGLKQVERARELTLEGLRHAPDSEELKKRAIQLKIKDREWKSANAPADAAASVASAPSPPR